jgi:regulator of protease activity HflC (stomatin/prohibitin superfamily)
MDMFLFITGIVLMVVAVISVLIAFVASSKGGPIGTALVTGIIGIVVIAFSATTIVQPRTVGVEVVFGKPTDRVLSNGLHWKAPWANVEKLDGAVQNDIYTGDHAVKVRLGNNSEAQADASIQWQLRTDDAKSVFLDYRNFENIQNNLVDRNFRATMNEVMATYDPLNEVKEDGTQGNQLGVLSEDVLEKMRERVGKQVDIKSVTIPIVSFDGTTQDRINALQTEISNTRIAEQKKQTSVAEAQANEALQKSLSPEVLTSKCLDIISESGKSPIGCFPNSGVTPLTMVGDEAAPQQ